MKHIIVLLVIAIAGCTYSADRWELEYALNKCKGHGGIHHIETYTAGTINAWCMDGTKVIVPLTPRVQDDLKALVESYQTGVPAL